MEELRKLLCELADDTIEMTEDTLDMCPDTVLSECFPFVACRTVNIDGYNYKIKYHVDLKPITD